MVEMLSPHTPTGEPVFAAAMPTTPRPDGDMLSPRTPVPLPEFAWAAPNTPRPSGL
jgi:hypothetical protein